MELRSAQRYFENMGLTQETPVKNTWIDHPVYGYKIPVSNDIRLDSLKLLV